MDKKAQHAQGSHMYRQQKEVFFIRTPIPEYAGI
jgi:hypothetical protein